MMEPSHGKSNYHRNKAGGQVSLVLCMEEFGVDGWVDKLLGLNRGDHCLLPIS